MRPTSAGVKSGIYVSRASSPGLGRVAAIRHKCAMTAPLDVVLPLPVVNTCLAKLLEAMGICLVLGINFQP